MVKNLKLNITNTQIASAIHLDEIKASLAKQIKAKPAAKKETSKQPKAKVKKSAVKEVITSLSSKTPKKTRAKTKKIEPETSLPPILETPAPLPENKEPLIASSSIPTPSPEIKPEPTPPKESLEPLSKKEPTLDPSLNPHIIIPLKVPNARPSLMTPKRSDQQKPLDNKQSTTLETSAEQKKDNTTETLLKPKDKKQVKTKAEEEEEAFSNRKLKKNKVRSEGEGSNFWKFKSTSSFTNFDEIYQAPKLKKSFGKKKLGEALPPPPPAVTIPTHLKVKVPISLKDLANLMKVKAAKLISSLFLQGLTATINDSLEDETTLQLLGQELGCEITIDTSEEEKIAVTGESIAQEIANTPSNLLAPRSPIIAFLGHVDHGKTSLIDAIRSSNIVDKESGAITQHIGAFRHKTSHGVLSIIDTPGHAAFSAMRERGADVTDIIVLVIAGDEGIKEQTIEVIKYAKSAKIPIIVAINKCDKPNFNAEEVYRQLADHHLLPEAWGGELITISCSAVTKQGIPELLEMIMLQAEMLELKANPTTRARGVILESSIHPGLGNIATLIIQNGTLRYGNVLVCNRTWGRIKAMHDEYGKTLKEASPSMPVKITGLTGTPNAGDEFIVVASEKEAKEIVEARMAKLETLKKKAVSFDELLEQKEQKQRKKQLNILIKADVQGSLEAIQTCLSAIESEKVQLNIITSDVGAISQSDVELAEASNAIIIGFQTKPDSRAEPIIRDKKIPILLHNVIYHILDDVKEYMIALLDKIPQETERGKANIIATFKSSQLGTIAGCLVTEGSINRSHFARVFRENEKLWQGKIQSIRKEKDDVREVTKGTECGVTLDGFRSFKIGDVIQTYEVNYIVPEL